MSRIAIIGGGSMGEALLAGLLRAGRQVKDMVVAEKYPDRAKYLADKYSVLVTSVADAADNAAYVVIAVKPGDVANVIDEIADAAARADSDTAEQVFVTIAAGVSTSYYENKLPAGSPVVRVMPNSPIVVARRVHLVADLRSASPEIVAAARASLLADIAEIAREHDIRINVRDFDIRDKRHFPTEGVELAEKAVANEGLSIRRLETMAGHDSVAMNHRVPAVMMFVPSVDGVSHCEREFTTDEDMIRGVRVLTSVAGELVRGELADVRDGAVWVGSSVAEARA